MVPEYPTRPLTVRQQPDTEADPLPQRRNHDDCRDGDLAARNGQDCSVTCRLLTCVHQPFAEVGSLPKPLQIATQWIYLPATS